MKDIWKTFKITLTSFVLLTVLCGVIYPGIVTAIAQAVFPKQANGSMITVILKDGTKKTYGSGLIEQEFTKAEYLIGRPSGVTNLSPVSEEQAVLVGQRISRWHGLDPGNSSIIPVDLITASGSGVDPNISPEAAEYQVPRIALERNMSEEDVRKIISKYTSGRFLGFWGEPSVNVLKVNLALDGLL